MDLLDVGSRWEIPTSFGWVLVRLVGPNEPPLDSKPAAVERREYARVQLFFELASLPLRGRVVLAELSRRLRPRGEAYASPSLEPAFDETENRELERLITLEASAGRLELDWRPYWTEPLRERDPIEGDPGPLRALPPPEPETSFINVNLVDQDGKPVIGQVCQIELPDGSKHTVVTDLEGWARVRGFKQDGDAKITFPGIDELDFSGKPAGEKVVIPVQGDPEPEAPAEVEPAEALTLGDGPNFVELAFVDVDGKPLADVPFEVSTDDGKKVNGKTDANGLARVEGISPDKATVTLLDSAAGEG